ncbi:hypothetical protein LWI28_002263 [Acer negundo]|uniref:Cotton fiber protein n=1 Tax=Acer negundo TaxID=4023 RepID=A0AAD5NTJ2_ACENE|nr:hypothetical protein LWI28_002263 [Acer negundo]KAK4848832.1 hypothetical protein QYF36_017934 [Acer negundo]
MAKKNRGGAANRTWKLLRMALLWTRKGRVLRRRLMMELRVVPKFIKNLKNSSTSRDQLHYGERELSFDKTPIFHVKMHRPASMRFLIPCITPQADFDYDFNLDDDDDYDQNYGYGTESYLKNDDQEEQEEEEERVAIEEEGIDSRAEEFIAKFYEQIKMQRQISYLEYNERLK